MQLWTLEQLRRSAKREAGLRGDKALTDPDWLDMINRAIAQIWAALTANEASGYGLVDGTITATPGQGFIALPADHQRTLQVNRPIQGTAGQYEPAVLTTRSAIMDRYPESDGEDIERPGVYYYLPTAIHVRPTPKVAEVLKILYVKVAPVLADDGDTVDTIAGFEESIICYAAGYATQDTGRRDRLLARAEKFHEVKIASWSGKRDKGPHYMRDYQKRGRAQPYR